MDSKGDFSQDTRILLLSALALIIGAFCAYIAVILLWLIGFFTNLFFYQKVSIHTVSPASALDHLGLFLILVPVVGGLIIGFMARFGSEKIRGHGIPEALEAILFGRSRMQPKIAILKPLSSAISIGSGGPFGAEGPIIMTGGAFGSIFAQMLNLSASERKTLLVAGAAAGMSATFAAPVSSVLLAVELLLFEWKPRSLIPVAVASSVAAVLRTYLLGAGPLFPVPDMAGLTATDYGLALVLGLVAGVLSSALTRFVYLAEDLFHKIPVHWMWWPAIGGLVVGIGGYFQPRVLGVGYDLIGDFLGGNVTTSTAALLVLAKAFVWVVALGSGTSGGVLAPLLIMGTGAGLFLQNLIHFHIPGMLPLLGLGSILGGVMRSPFTGVMFSYELTHAHNMFLPLLIACVTSYGFTVLTMKRSILTEKVARRGYNIFREYSVDFMSQVTAKEVMTQPVESIPMQMSCEELVNKYFHTFSNYQGFPVIDGHRLVGIVTRSDLQKIKGANPQDVSVGSIMSQPAVTALPTDSCRAVCEQMALANIGRIPVVLPENVTKVVGIVTRADLLKALLQHLDEEGRRERFLGRDVIGLVSKVRFGRAKPL